MICQRVVEIQGALEWGMGELPERMIAWLLRSRYSSIVLYNTIWSPVPLLLLQITVVEVRRRTTIAV